MNVVFILADSLRRDYVGTYGNEAVKTPHLDRLGERGTVFDQAWIGSYACMPARRDIWTGRLGFPRRGWGPLEYDDKSLPALITETGRKAMLVTDNWHYWAPGSGNYHHGFSSVEFVRGQAEDPWMLSDEAWTADTLGANPPAGHLKDQERSWAQYQRNQQQRTREADYPLARVMARSVELLQQNRESEDFFLCIDVMGPHEPFDAPQSYRNLYLSRKEVGPGHLWPTYGQTLLQEADREQIRGLYAASVSMLDRWIGVLVEQLEQLQLRDQTAIVVTSDHGYLLGEHGLMGRPWAGLADSNLYQEIARIPLIIYHPGVRVHRVPTFVQLVDLHPTVLDLLGLPHDVGNDGAVSLLSSILETGSGTTWRDGVAYGRFGEALNVTTRDGTLMLWWDPVPGNVVTHYWYGLHPPGPAEPLQAVGGLQDNQRWPVQAPRGKSMSAVYLPEDEEQTDNVLDKDSAEVVQPKLMKVLTSALTVAGAPDELYTAYGLPLKKGLFR